MSDDKDKPKAETKAVAKTAPREAWVQVPFELTHGPKGWSDKPAKKDEAK